MYAVVEFENRDCMVVPLSWLCDNQTKCYWPKISTEEQFYSYVKSCKDPKSSWNKYTVGMILHVEDDYEKADQHLIKAIEESCTSDGEVEKLGLKNIITQQDDLFEASLTPKAQKQTLGVCPQDNNNDER
ncbi:hypothetical protein NQ314_016561 [Rhamnusium bicolor]|uniref:Uncharacterized protein n=1 Tax=Rhamnusium bicolor TaxID=1586634 RepID=A0AAV8WVZ5_9CUCU|nr:hypothetical protein NQ314_016561 [Rhamnusium bicolor]